MAIPSNPTVQDIILQGMREAGRYSITASQSAYTEFYNYQWATIKTEIWNACRTDRLLEAETLLSAARGSHNVTLPADFDNEIQVALYDWPDDWHDNAQAGTSSTITLASDFSEDEERIRGLFIFIVSGTGLGQFKLIAGYNNTTKVLTPANAWATTPDSTSEYILGYRQYLLPREDYRLPTSEAIRPRWYSRVGTLFYVYPTPDKTYPVLMTYRANLTRLDEDSALFVKHLRERRHLWVQGVKVKTMARYDDERYELEKQIWEQMLRQYGGQNVVYDRMEPSR